MLPADRIIKREMTLRRSPTVRKVLERARTSRELQLHCRQVLCRALDLLRWTMGTTLRGSRKSPMVSGNANSGLTNRLTSFIWKLLTRKAQCLFLAMLILTQHVPGLRTSIPWAGHMHLGRSLPRCIVATSAIRLNSTRDQKTK